MGSRTLWSFMNRLQTQIFTFFVVLLLAIQAVSFWMTYNGNQLLQSQRLDNQMSVARLVFQSEYENRNYYLSAFADTAAKDFGLKDIFIDGDERSFLVALNNHRKRIKADMAIAVSAEGMVIGQLVLEDRVDPDARVQLGSEQNQMFRYQFDTEFQTINTLYRLNDRVYQIRFAPLTSGVDAIIGWVGFGYLIDNTLADTLHQLTSLHAGFLLIDESDNALVIASSETATDVKNLDVVLNYVQQDIADLDFILWKEAIGTVDSQTLYAYMYVKRADVLQTLEDQWGQQLSLILLMLPLSLIVAFYIARSVTRPINILVGQAQYIAKGNYESQVSIGNSIEMQRLANEFTAMQKAIVSREQKITHQASHDPLTNLSNRNGLEQTVIPWITQQYQVVIFLINVRRITDVNVTLGHIVGDEVIREVGRRLSDMADIDLVCRLSGDEYVLAFRSLPNNKLPAFLERLNATMDPEYRYQDIALHLQITVGISSMTPGADLITLLRQADTALHHAKSNKLPYQVYDIQIDKNTVGGFQLLNDLKTAIDGQQLVLFYQPKMTIETNTVDQVEALVRWKHPVRGLIGPDIFIPIAEKTGQINALSRWVFTEAIDQYLRWKKQGITLGIAVNLSAENLANQEFTQWILDMTIQHDVPPSAFTLEITEDAVVADPEAAIEVLCRWKLHGFRLSIDDYGTGYSSLVQLKQLPVDELKIDKSFILQLLHHADDQIIVESTILLAHNLGLTVVAEGIENGETLDWLRRRACEKAQGFFVSRPVPADALEQWLASGGYVTASSET